MIYDDGIDYDEYIEAKCKFKNYLKNNPYNSTPTVEYQKLYDDYMDKLGKLNGCNRKNKNLCRRKK